MPDLIVSSSELRRKIKDLRSKATQSLIICSAFCRSKTFQALFCDFFEVLPKQRILVRWRLEDLVNGASDIETYFCAKQNGWEVFINFDLHAKCYIFDNLSLIGSANLTEAGVPDTAKKNIELCVLRNNDYNLHNWVEQVFLDSIRLSDILVEHIQKDLDKSRLQKHEHIPTFSSETLSFLYNTMGNYEIFTSDFPWISSPKNLTIACNHKDMRRNKEHDYLLFAINIPLNFDEIRRNFIKSKCWKWIVMRIGEGKYFGELSELLHNDLSDDPAPFRKDVKELLQNLLSWSAAIVPELIEIDRPRHSQRVRLKF